jgi:hypothetical protein
MTSSLAPKPKAGALSISDNALNGLQSATTEATAVYSDATSGSVVAALKSAIAIQSLRTYFDDPGIRSAIVALQDSPLGFRTDRDPKIKKKDRDGSYKSNIPYEYEIVKEAAIEALLRGLQLVGNQFNIIAGRFYCTKEGFEALIKVAPITDFQLNIGVPKSSTGGVTVECSATWIQEKTVSFAATIPVKSDQYSTADQLIGKATRKFLSRCYQQMSGKTMPDGDSSEPAAQPLGGTAPSILEAAPTAAPATLQPSSSAAPDSDATLTEEQRSRLDAAMAKRLSAVGARAFEVDVCACFQIDGLESLPAVNFRDVIGGLGNETSVERWNMGRASGGDGPQILTDEEISELQADSGADDDVQQELV